MEITNSNARILRNLSLLDSYVICITMHCDALDQFSLETATFHFGINVSINYSTLGNQTINDTIFLPQNAHTSPIKPYISITSRASILDVVFGRLKEAEKTKAVRKKSRKAHGMINASSGHTALSAQYCKSDLAPVSIGLKVLQPPGAKCCWIKILQMQVNFVPAGFVLLWVSSVAPKAGTEDGGSINTTARDVSNLTEMGAYIHAPAGLVGDLVVSSSTSNEHGTTIKKREETFRLRAD